MDEIMSTKDQMLEDDNEERTMDKEDTKKHIEIDPNILIDCIDYTNALVNGYRAIYQNFQKILWTMRKRGVSASDATAATMEIMNRASAKASAETPHRDPFEEPPEDEKKKEVDPE